MGLKTSVTEWGRLLAGWEGGESLNYTWAKTYSTQREVRSTCVSAWLLGWRPGCRQWGLMIQSSITLSLNKNDSLKYPVILFHTHSLQLIFYDPCSVSSLSLSSVRVGEDSLQCCFTVCSELHKRGRTTYNSAQVKRVSLYKIHLKNTNTHTMARFA